MEEHEKESKIQWISQIIKIPLLIFLATIFLDTYLCKHVSKNHKNATLLYMWFHYHFLSTTYQKSFKISSFKPHNIYFKYLFDRYFGFFPDFLWLWITLQQAQCIFRTAFQNSCHMQIYILSVKKLHCPGSLFPWKCPSLSKPGLVNRSSTIPDYTGCDWWRKFHGVPSIICFLGGSTIERNRHGVWARQTYFFVFDRSNIEV